MRGGGRTCSDGHSGCAARWDPRFWWENFFFGTIAPFRKPVHLHENRNERGDVRIPSAAAISAGSSVIPRTNGPEEEPLISLRPRLHVI